MASLRFGSVGGAAGPALVLGAAVQLPGPLLVQPLCAGRYNQHDE